MGLDKMSQRIHFRHRLHYQVARLHSVLLLSPLTVLTQSKEKVFIPNLLDFERYWTRLIDEHCGALTADPATQVFSI